VRRSRDLLAALAADADVADMPAQCAPLRRLQPCSDACVPLQKAHWDSLTLLANLFDLSLIKRCQHGASFRPHPP